MQAVTAATARSAQFVTSLYVGDLEGPDYQTVTWVWLCQLRSRCGESLGRAELYVGPFVRNQEREILVDKTKLTNVFVNMSEEKTEQDLRKIFGEFGLLNSVVVMRNEDEKSKCFGFVNFENVEDAIRSFELLNGKKFDNKEWYVGRAPKKSEGPRIKTPI
ncbi:unnamed protein product [Fraxinus pennsylvanica]|uniref:RRM domain-containing protein n=1 Tax=Fraxinus pennsylvanica TaxID=56036 RepID=A0AAD2DSI0_9LAMI|nr:unnamed protein product [Fraxinus pennsylvanica]